MNSPHDHPAALVTGGSKRVGRAVVLRLAQAGYRVAIHANRSVEEAEALVNKLRHDGGQAFSLSADLTEEGVARSIVDEASDHFGRLDAVVHCAAVWSPKRLEEVVADDLRHNLEVNVIGAFLVAQQAGLRMCKQGTGGAIVLFGDAACDRPQVDYAAYHPSKGAIPVMTRSLAVELGCRNPRVRVNAVLPGPVLASESEPAERREHVASGVLVDAVGDASHLAAAAQHLLENPFMTGTCLKVDGGRTLAAGW